MSKSNKLLYVAALDEDNNICYAESSSKGRSYYCIHCKSEMILRKSEARIHRPHFAHKNNAINCSPETVLHYLFKIRLYERIKDALTNNDNLKITWNCEECREVHEGNLLKNASKVYIEKKVADYRPDILLEDSSGKPLAVIEVVFTHDIDSKARAFYKDNNIHIIKCKIANEHDLKRIDEEPFFLNYVNYCKYPRCEIHGEIMWPIYLMIGETQCYRCNSKMNLAVHKYREGAGGPDGFDDKTLKYVRQNGVIVKRSYSKTAGEAYLANTCPKCGAFIGWFFLDNVSDNMRVTISHKIGYECYACVED